MILKKRLLLKNIVFLLAVSILFGLVGCCGSKKITKNSKSKSFTKSFGQKKSKSDSNKVDLSLNSFNDIDIDISGELPLKGNQEQTKELYKKLDYANVMLKKHNYDGSLREIKRIQQVVHDDPYLMTQTWALAAKVYDKMGNINGRKRSFKKMMDSLAQVQKDSRYKNAYSDGMVCQKLIAYVEEKGGKKYDFK